VVPGCTDPYVYVSRRSGSSLCPAPPHLYSFLPTRPEWRHHRCVTKGEQGISCLPYAPTGAVPGWSMIRFSGWSPSGDPEASQNISLFKTIASLGVHTECQGVAWPARQPARVVLYVPLDPPMGSGADLADVCGAPYRCAEARAAAHRGGGRVLLGVGQALVRKPAAHTGLQRFELRDADRPVGEYADAGTTR
jgi:hypothetical protein